VSSETTNTTPANVSSSVLGTDVTNPASFRQRIAGRGAKFALKQAGLVLSKKEARGIAKESGKSVAEVLSSATQQGVGLGAGLVNQFNKGKLGPGFASGPMAALAETYGFMPGQSRGVTKALQTLEPLRGLSMPKGGVYLGSTARESGGTTTFTPVVMPRQVLQNMQTAAPTAGGYATPTQAGTAAESAATTTTPTTPVTSEVSTTAKESKKRQAKNLAKKQISKRKARQTGSQSKPNAA
jgi:hypothetical protein